MEIPIEIINKIKSFIPRDCDMKNKTVQCIKDIIDDFFLKKKKTNQTYLKQVSKNMLYCIKKLREISSMCV